MERTNFYVGALLHDIGKLLERSKDYPIDPIFRESSEYGHEAVSAAFISDYFDKSPLCNVEIRDLVWQHHKKNVPNEYCKILQIADWLSSGERRKQESGETSAEYNKVALQSIFSILFQQQEKWAYPLTYLQADEDTLFPRQNGSEIHVNDYQNLSRSFCNEFTHIKNDLQLYSLLEKYTWAIPSATPNIKSKSRADISLFDHSRTTAAIALCLLDQFELGFMSHASMIDPANILLDKTYHFLLVGGDFSGVQDFIFNVSSKRAAKSLKGRSFYLDLLSEVICRFLIKQLNLKEANILYNGGANFYILMPYSKKQQLVDLYHYLSKLLLQAHFGKLYLAMETLPLKPMDFLFTNSHNGKKGFSEKWRQVGERVGLKKLQRYKEISLEDVFKVWSGNEMPECPICHSDMKAPKPIEAGKDEFICTMCDSFSQLTEKLKCAKGLRISELRTSVDLSAVDFDFPNGYRDVFAALGFECSLLEKFGHTEQTLVFNDTNFIPGSGFRFGVFRLPGDSFDELAQRAAGAKKLALLKIDVDNLGQLFQKGLLPENNTISRVASISRELRLFFEGYLARLLQTDDYRDTIYPVFSGGDDTFLVGAWNQILELAAVIRTKFGEFVCQNPHITLSAGIVIVDEKFPIIRGAALAEEALHKAKQYQQGLKDKICLFGFVFTWDEFNYILEIKDILVALIKEMGESRSLLQKIMNSSRGFSRLLAASDKGKIPLERFWRFAYYLRTIKDHKKAEKLVSIYENMLIKHFTKKAKISIMIIPVSCRWAELQTRNLNH